MKATLTNTNEIITGKTMQEIRSKMNAMLRVDGPRALTANTDTGAIMHVELHENQDYITLANGRRITITK